MIKDEEVRCVKHHRYLITQYKSPQQQTRSLKSPPNQVRILFNEDNVQQYVFNKPKKGINRR